MRTGFEMVYERDVLLKDLSEHVCQVFFKKVGESQRVMRCSLSPNALPDSYELTEAPKVKDFHEKNPDIIAVWDLDNGGWRQFTMENVEYVQVVDTF